MALYRQAKARGKKIYSDIAIEFCLTIRSLFRLPYRQTEGFVKSLLNAAGIEIPVSSYTQFNRRTKRVEIKLNNAHSEGIHITAGSTGLKVYGEGEWKVRKHGWCKHRTWRKLHVAVNIDILTIEAATLTGNNEDDGSQVKPLIDEIKNDIVSFRGDGAYDSQKVRKLLEENNI